MGRPDRHPSGAPRARPAAPPAAPPAPNFFRPPERSNPGLDTPRIPSSRPLCPDRSVVFRTEGVRICRRDPGPEDIGFPCPTGLPSHLTARPRAGPLDHSGHTCSVDLRRQHLYVVVVGAGHQMISPVRQGAPAERPATDSPPRTPRRHTGVAPRGGTHRRRLASLVPTRGADSPGPRSDVLRHPLLRGPPRTIAPPHAAPHPAHRVPNEL